MLTELLAKLIELGPDFETSGRTMPNENFGLFRPSGLWIPDFFIESKHWNKNPADRKHNEKVVCWWFGCRKNDERKFSFIFIKFHLFELLR